ncbi:hypothetical protein QTH90_14765 [Variovorax sp. J2P1-59]|uniref:hypothetical protein n=1 Tax=Variovorax flavidus TaxID=3053501 RepID=UPI0025764553|nr:hypothetical protein [Variovorax sp. J2P1-59]MDM0075662.1 hypothetical protein [Variovorax sp. J2P1-59]
MTRSALVLGSRSNEAHDNGEQRALVTRRIAKSLNDQRLELTDSKPHAAFGNASRLAGCALNGCALLIAFLATPSVFACSPIKSIDIFFSKGSAAVSVAQGLRLAEWTATLRAQYPSRQLISIAANVEKGERGGAALGELRKRVIEDLIDDLDFTAAEKSTGGEVHVLPAGALGPGARNDVKRVEVTLLPACPHECPCQNQ